MLALSYEICHKKRAVEGVGSTPAALTNTMMEHRMADDPDTLNLSELEEWRAVPGYEGHYEVSSLGRVRSVGRFISRVMPDGSVQHQNRPEKIMGQWSRNGTWYPRVTLTVEFQKKTISVHTLVLEAFVGPAPHGTECRHLDGNMQNCRLENLAWATHLENEADKTAHGTRVIGEMVRNSVLTAGDVVAIRRRHAAGERQNAMAREFGVSKATICRAVKGRSWAHVK
jgi:hypothetical protein